LTWSTISPELREIIERVCTAAEVEVLKLKASGYGTRRTALVVGISRSAVIDRLRSAERKIMQEVAAQRGVR
jgi:DNA-binding CsgD family transcriptional regulator